MFNFKTKFKLLIKILICASFSSIPTSSAFESNPTMIADASEAFLGIESVSSDSYRIINLKRTVYVGECPGVRNKTTEGYFVDLETPVQEDYVVVLTNFAKGLSPNNPPSIEKDYDRGRASDKFKFKISSKRNKVYLSMQPGINPIKYEIIDESDRKNKTVVKSGIFSLQVKFDDTVYRRDKEYSPESGTYYCPWF